MKDADEMLKKILKEVDTNGDGKIQFEGTNPSSIVRYSSGRTLNTTSRLLTHDSVYRVPGLCSASRSPAF
jgi:hypothetical protein